MKRYNHWFWNSWAMDRVSRAVTRLASYLWSKRNGRNN